jgi:hypothetical protein
MKDFSSIKTGIRKESEGELLIFALPSAILDSFLPPYSKPILSFSGRQNSLTLVRKAGRPNGRDKA